MGGKPRVVELREKKQAVQASSEETVEKEDAAEEKKQEEGADKEKTITENKSMAEETPPTHEPAEECRNETASDAPVNKTSESAEVAAPVEYARHGPKVVEEREQVDYSLMLPKGVREEPDIVRKKREQSSRDALPMQRVWTPKEIDEAREIAKKIQDEKELEKIKNPLKRIGKSIRSFFRV